MSIVHVKNQRNGTTYVYESTGWWDKEKQQSRNKRVCIGKLDPITGELIPSKRLEETSLPDSLKPGPVPVSISQRRFYGATYLFDALATQLGIREDLQQCFPTSYPKILSVAYYLILEDRNPLSRFPKWARMHVHPYGKELSSQRSSELFASISEEARQRFFRLQVARRLEKEYLAYDTTSVSSYSKCLKVVQYGYNKEHDPLPQLNLALVFGERSRLPVYYRSLPGNIPDVKTLQELLCSLHFLEFPRQVKLVMDRGFYSSQNINECYRKHLKFLLATKMSLKLVKEVWEEKRQTMITRSHYSAKHELYVDTHLFSWDYTAIKPRSQDLIEERKRLYLHLYFNDQRAVDDRKSFHSFLDKLEEELKTGSRNPEHEVSYAKYFQVKETPRRGIQITPLQKAITEKEQNYGYFALISNDIKDPIEAIEIYRAKDLVEKAFGNLKERLNLRRTSVSSEENLEGKLFVQFIALTLLSYLQKAMSDHDQFTHYTLQEALDELDIIECIEQPGKRKRVSEMTQKQYDLYEVFGVTPPNSLV